MPHRSPHDLARMLAAVRIAAGVTFALTPARAGSVLVGRDARAPGARLFIRAFGARDVLLGAGTRRALGRRGAVRPWLYACVLADTFDALATLAQFDELPQRRRTLTFAISLAPALGGNGSPAASNADRRRVLASRVRAAHLRLARSRVEKGSRQATGPVRPGWSARRMH
jgi:hypothetical protein